MLKFSPPAKLLRMADIFCFCWNDGLVLYDLIYLCRICNQLYTWGVGFPHLHHDCFRGGPNSVVAERRADFCVERHHTHHGAQVTDSKW